VIIHAHCFQVPSRLSRGTQSVTVITVTPNLNLSDLNSVIRVTSELNFYHVPRDSDLNSDHLYALFSKSSLHALIIDTRASAPTPGPEPKAALQ
jgi:hypothetical protein